MVCSLKVSNHRCLYTQSCPRSKINETDTKQETHYIADEWFVKDRADVIIGMGLDH